MRIKCNCGYPMLILEETEEYYQCYCADCKTDRYISKVNEIENGTYETFLKKQR